MAMNPPKVAQTILKLTTLRVGMAADAMFEVTPLSIYSSTELSCESNTLYHIKPYDWLRFYVCY